VAERRPRIPVELSARIDAVRGDVPFERWVRRELEARVVLLEGVAAGQVGRSPAQHEVPLVQRAVSENEEPVRAQRAAVARAPVEDAPAAPLPRIAARHWA
jgi:hypothetical protein